MRNPPELFHGTRSTCCPALYSLGWNSGLSSLGTDALEGLSGLTFVLGRDRARMAGLLSPPARAGQSLIKETTEFSRKAHASAWSQNSRTIKAVVPFAPGGGMEIVALLIADQITRTPRRDELLINAFQFSFLHTQTNLNDLIV